MNNKTLGEMIARVLWAAYEFEQQRKFAWRVNAACGTLLAIIMGFNALLVWLIWFSR